MTLRRLDKPQWRNLLDRFSKALVGKRAEIEVASLSLGVQPAAEYLPLLGVAYDPKDDIIEVALDGFDHIIHGPQELWIDETGGTISSMEIVDKEGVRQIVLLRDPLMLPAPSSGA